MQAPACLVLPPQQNYVCVCVCDGVSPFFTRSQLSLYGHTGVPGSGRSPL